MGTRTTVYTWQQRNNGREAVEGAPETVLQLCSRCCPMAT